MGARRTLVRSWRAGHSVDNGQEKECEMAEIDARLREEVHLLGQLLGHTISNQLGDEFLDKIERIRKAAKAGRRGSDAGAEQLTSTLGVLGDDELLPVARAFKIGRASCREGQ